MEQRRYKYVLKRRYKEKQIAQREFQKSLRPMRDKGFEKHREIEEEIISTIGELTECGEPRHFLSSVTAYLMRDMPKEKYREYINIKI